MKPSPVFESDFDALLDFCVQQIAGGADYASYAIRIARAAPVLFPPPAVGALRDDPDLHRRLSHCLTRAIWKATPHPAHHYAVAPLPGAERNASCHCGSGRKYKHCCEEMERTLPMRDMNLLPSLLDALPRARWAELAGSRVSADRVAHVAAEWREEGRGADIARLLEPWFADDAGFVARRELLFDSLLDAYTVLRKPRKKAALLARAQACGDAEIRAAAVQRRVTMAADGGDYAQAWRLFDEAQRLLPDSPSLSHLEVTVLISEGRVAQARERARFWIARLQRRRDPRLDGLIDFLRGVAEHGAGAMVEMAASNDPAFGEFLEAWRRAPPVASSYTLQPEGPSAGPLRPQRSLAAVLAEWHESCPPLGYSPIDTDMRDMVIVAIHAWLPLLRRRPELWNAFDVLDAASTAARYFGYAGVDDAVALPILERGEQLLREVLRANGAEGLRLEWGWTENRPALSLVAARIVAEANAGATPSHIARLEWLVCTLNPDDNQGFRNTLVRRYLEAGRIDDAVVLTARYPDDFAAMRYNRALALFAAGDTGAALTALDDAVRLYPKPLAWLLKANPKPPRAQAYGIVVGGDDEAWIYRAEMLPVWQKLAALAWARTVAKALKARR